MISICIPVYNTNISELVKELAYQMERIRVESELILIDDGSQTSFKNTNRAIGENHQYIELPKNIGRSAIRNLFLTYAQYNHLLFLDGDVRLTDLFFLQNYVNALQAQPTVKVWCGGRVYVKFAPKEKEYFLHWKYRSTREPKPAHLRKQDPYINFMTNNFLIHRTVFDKVKFDTSIKNYGHEDTFFALNLKKQEVPISHLENPVLNPDVLDVKVFLDRTEQAVANLRSILEHLPQEDQSLFITHVRLLRVYKKLQPIRFVSMVLSKVVTPVLKYIMIKGYLGNSLYLLDLYKLCLLYKMNTH